MSRAPLTGGLRAVFLTQQTIKLAQQKDSRSPQTTLLLGHKEIPDHTSMPATTTPMHKQAFAPPRDNRILLTTATMHAILAGGTNSVGDHVVGRALRGKAG